MNWDHEVTFVAVVGPDAWVPTNAATAVPGADVGAGSGSRLSEM
jgi:hypothetical protein